MLSHQLGFTSRPDTSNVMQIALMAGQLFLRINILSI